MIFSSPLFLFSFLPLFFLAYAFAGSLKLKNYVILIGSIIFYAWIEPKFIFLLIISIYFDWLLGNLIFKSQDNKNVQKWYFILALALNIGLLAYFKYTNFFVENMNNALSILHINNLFWKKIALPVGISFIVFEKISYIADIYRGAGKPAKSFDSYALFVLLFTKLLAGPIVQYHDMADQLYEREHSSNDIIYGIYRFSAGLAKKVLVADVVGIVVDEIFKLPAQSISLYYSWLGIVCFALQIYFDFSGYSDMAIGMSRIMGFRLVENFNFPYISANITEFWRRWHMSLSAWLRDYLYTPLAFSVRSWGKLSVIFALMVTFTLCGLWHGANWTFVVWGIYQGIFLAFDWTFWQERSKKLPKIFNIVLTFLVIMIGWVIFRAETLNYAGSYLLAMFNFTGKVLPQNFQFVYIFRSFKITVLIALILSFFPATRSFVRLENIYNNMKDNDKTAVQMYSAIILLFFAILKISTSSFIAFLYFRF